MAGRVLLALSLAATLALVCPQARAEGTSQPQGVFAVQRDASTLARSLRQLQDGAQSLKPHASQTMIDVPTRESGGAGPDDADTDVTGGTAPDFPAAIGVTASMRRMEIERVFASIGAEAVYFATMQTGNTRLTFSGTITERGNGNYTYAGGPDDRLRVKFGTGQSIDYIFEDFSGDYSQPDATSFLRRDHRIAFRLVSSWGSDVTVNLQKRGDRYLNTLKGTVSDGQAAYRMSTTTEGEVVSDVSSSGAEYQSREEIAGTVETKGLKVNIRENFRYHFVMFDNAVEDVQHRISNTWEIGSDRYVLVDGNIFRTFKNGTPSELDSWKASGALTRSGVQIGGLRMRQAGASIETVLVADQQEATLYSDRLP